MTPRWPFLLLLVAGLALIAAGLLWLQAPGRDPADRPALTADGKLPAQLGGVPASGVETGTAALDVIERMHGKGFDLAGGAVAHYGAATVWVSRSPDAQRAADMTIAMRDRIAEGRSPFTPTGTQQVDDRLVYALTGMGQTHFYWQAGDKVVWLASPADRAQQDLAELVGAIR